jgi:tape measure domain-containing protein
MASRSKIEVILSAKDSGLTTALKRGQAELRLFSSQVQGAVSPFGTLIGAALSLKTALAGFVAVAGITALGKSLLAAGTEMDKLRLAYGAISGSSQAAAEEMQFVSDTATKLGLSFQETAGAYKQITAAAQGTKLAGAQTREIFTGIAQASTVLGLSAEETSGALLAISQMISKGKVSAEELRGQLGERLPGAFQIAAQAMGLSTAALDKMMASGNLTADVFLPKFATALQTRFGDASVKAAGTFTAAGNRIQSGLFGIQSAIGQAVTNNTFFVDAMGRVSTMLGSLGKDAQTNAATWRQWAKDASLAVLDVGVATVKSTSVMYQAFSGVKGAIESVLAYYYELQSAWRTGAAEGAKLKQDLTFGLMGEEAQQLAVAAAESSSKLKQFTESAANSFSEMSAGSTKILKASESLQKFRDELGKVKSDAVNPVEGVAKKADLEFKQIGGKWVGVEKQIIQNNEQTTEQVGVNWGTVWSNMAKDGSNAAEVVDEALNKAARPREAVITVREVQARAQGGLIQRFAGGGKLPGYGGGDRISALLEAGEFVIRKEAVSKFGAGIFHALNALRLPELPKFATGGLVAAGPTDTVNIMLTLPSGSTYPMTGSRTTAEQINRENARMHRLRSR